MKSTEINKPIVSRIGESKKVSAIGIDVYIKVPSESTDYAWSLVEYHLPPTKLKPKPHYHKKMQELFYVIEGSLEFYLNGETILAEKGTYVLVPKGAWHTFSNPTNEKVVFQTWFSPGGFEEYFVELFPMINEATEWPPKDLSTLIALMNKYDTFSI